eukprot:TRINITY_DN61833_c0_g1_i4.p3 TRINITY_DN61833_c0_g1~~TRINITY_DN61833_c0_g1_i4.p3  ORF type:complete len:104 (-),score=14.31 TRINITY_DN61833_c0_g1_i4:148-423(-)
MKVLMIAVFKHQGTEKPPMRLAFASDLTSFGYFTRSTVQEHLHFGAKTVVQRTNAGFRQSVSMKDNPFLVHVRNWFFWLRVERGVLVSLCC